MNQFLRALVLCACVLAVSCGEAQQQQDNNSNSTLTKLQLRFKNENVAKKQDDGPLALIGKLFKFFEVAKKEEESEQRQEQVIDEKSSNSTRRKRQAYGYGAPAPSGGYGAPAGGYGAPMGGYGAPAGGYGAPAGGYGAPAGGYGAPGYGPAPSDYQFDDFYTNDFLYDYYDWVCSEENCQLCNILTAECCNPAVNPNCILPDSCLNNPCLSGGTCIPSRTLDQLNNDFICVCLPGFTGKYCQLTNEFLLPPFDDDEQPGYGGYQQPQAPSYGGGYQQPQAPSYGGGYQQPQAQPNYGRPPYQQAAPAPQYGQAAPAPQYQAPAPQYQAPAPQYQQAAPQYQQAAPQYQQAAPAPQYQQAAPAPQYQAPQYQQQQRAAPVPSYGQAAPAPAPQYQQAAPQRSAPGPAAYGAQGQVRTLSAKATNWEGFDCNCQGKGYCAQVGTEESSEPEFFCICNDNTYGSRCDEGFRNPCADNTLKARFAPIDRQVPGYYFIECKTSLPYVRKCENGKRFNPKTNMCQQVKQRSAPRPQGLMQQQQQQQ